MAGSDARRVRKETEDVLHQTSNPAMTDQQKSELQKIRFRPHEQSAKRTYNLLCKVLTTPPKPQEALKLGLRRKK